MNKSSYEFKEMQRERIRATKPWLKSTGAKTTYGKERSKMNALKMSPSLYNLIKELNEITKHNRAVNQKVSILLTG